MVTIVFPFCVSCVAGVILRLIQEAAYTLSNEVAQLVAVSLDLLHKPAIH